MKKLISSVLVAAAMLPLTMSAQKITLGGQFGWAVPQGSAFEYNGKKMTGGGLALDFDLMYHLESFDNRLAAGLTYNSSFLFGAGGDETGFGVGLYGLTLYGVKGYYKFFNTKVSPYAALSLGVSQFSAPEVTVNGEVARPADNSFSLGIRPEVGIQFGGFFISAAYSIPMSYTIYEEKMTGGALQISLGFRARMWGESDR